MGFPALVFPLVSTEHCLGGVAGQLRSALRTKQLCLDLPWGQPFLFTAQAGTKKVKLSVISSRICLEVVGGYQPSLQPPVRSNYIHKHTGEHTCTQAPVHVYTYPRTHTSMHTQRTCIHTGVCLFFVFRF